MLSDEDDDWPATAVGKKLYRFEQLLCCEICLEIFNNPHSLQCGHVFCYICLSKRFDRVYNTTSSSDTCPKCRNKAELSHLKPNVRMSELVESFRELKQDLKKSVLQEAETVDANKTRASSRVRLSGNNNNSPETSALGFVLSSLLLESLEC